MNGTEKDLLVTAAYCIIGFNAALKKILELTAQEARKHGDEKMANAADAAKFELY